MQFLIPVKADTCVQRTYVRNQFSVLARHIRNTCVAFWNYLGTTLQNSDLNDWVWSWVYYILKDGLIIERKSVSHSVASDSQQPHGLYSPPGSSVLEFSRQEYSSGLPFPSPGDLANPGIKPKPPALQADSLPSPTWGALVIGILYFSKNLRVL